MYGSLSLLSYLSDSEEQKGRGDVKNSSFGMASREEGTSFYRGVRYHHIMLIF